MYNEEAVRIACEMEAALVKGKGTISVREMRSFNDSLRMEPTALDIVEEWCSQFDGTLIYKNGAYYFLPEINSVFAYRKSEVFPQTGDSIGFLNDIRTIVLSIMLHILCAGDERLRAADNFTTVDIVVDECNKAFLGFVKDGERAGYPKIEEVYESWNSLLMSPDKIGPGRRKLNSKEMIVRDVWDRGCRVGIFEEDKEKSDKIRVTERCSALMPTVLSQSRATEINEIIRNALRDYSEEA